MLVLSRRVGESIVIDGNIRLKIVEATGSRVRLAVEAPPDVLVDRQEVHECRMQFADPREASPCTVTAVSAIAQVNGASQEHSGRVS